MSDFINQNDNSAENDKDLILKRKEEQIERVKRQYQTDVEERQRAEERFKEEQEIEKKIAPLLSVRKFLTYVCGFMWIFSVFCLLTGTIEMKIFLSMFVYVIFAMAAVNVPIFFHRKKIRDMIICIICAVICFIFATSVLFLG